MNRMSETDATKIQFQIGGIQYNSDGIWIDKDWLLRCQVCLVPKNTLPRNQMSNLRVENERDQSLRPWTLDITSDESIAVECGKLDTTVKRSSPFKQGGDYAYLTKLKSSTSDTFETTELTITSPKPKQNYSRFHQGQVSQLLKIGNTCILVALKTSCKRTFYNMSIDSYLAKLTHHDTAH